VFVSRDGLDGAGSQCVCRQVGRVDVEYLFLWAAACRRSGPTG
jgi:hypothetical protein